MSARFFALSLLLAVSVCGAADPAEFSVGGLVFTRPDGWAWVAPTSPMRKAQFSVKSADAGVPAEVVFFAFGPGEGGGVEANVRRWLGQFEPDGKNDTADRHEENIGGIPVTFVSQRGTFAGGMPGGPASPQPDYALRGAILSAAQGTVFVKMTGPEKTVRAAGESFLEMVRRAHPG